MSRQRHGPAGDRSALVVLDVFSTFLFPGGDALFSETTAVAVSIRELCARFRARHRPVIFANDNFDRWDDDFDGMLARVADSGDLGRRMVGALRPQAGDYRLLKPRHSAFFETPLPSLLAHLQVTGLVICGIATDSCVLATVMDAHVRGLDSVVPVDTTASQTSERTARTLLHLRDSCNVATPRSGEVFS